MNCPLTYWKYKYRISRQAPCIVYYEYKFSGYNDQVISIMEKMAEKFKYVLCYKVDWDESCYLPFDIENRLPSDVLSFQDSQVTMRVSVFNQTELENLFKTVYNDSIKNFLISTNRLLIAAGRIEKRHNHKPYYLPNPSYNINRDKREYSSQKINLKNYEIPPNTLKANTKDQSIHSNTNINSNIRVLHKDGSILVPVKSGLPRIDIFLIPISTVGTCHYFETPKTKLNNINTTKNLVIIANKKIRYKFHSYKPNILKPK